MSLVLLLVVLAVIAGIAIVAAGRGGGLSDVAPDRSPRGRLPSGDISREQVDGLRFTLALRGYRMDEVDDVLDRLVGEIEARDARIADLETGAAPDADADAGAADPDLRQDPDVPRAEDVPRAQDG